MSPCFAADYMLDVASAHAKFPSHASNRTAIGIPRANKPYRVLGQNGLGMTLPQRKRISISTASFLDHIHHIVQLRTQEQMVWADTIPYITMVKDLESVRNWSVVENPRAAMGQSRVGFGIDHGKYSVTIRHDMAPPEPTAFRLFYISVKPLHRLQLVGPVALAVTESHTTPSIDFAGTGKKLNSTLKTDSGNGRLRGHRQVSPFGVTGSGLLAQPAAQTHIIGPHTR